MLDKAEAKEVATQYSNEVQRILKPDKVVLFGSYAGGTPREESDIDVGVFVHGLSDEAWYNVRISLQRLRRNKLFLDIEPHLLDETNDVSGFARHVINTGEILYQQ